jgi:dihydroorotate dehydrogenase (NAD+) catalytic subunit
MEFIVTGATAVQVGTANFLDPATPVRIVEELLDWAHRGWIRGLAGMIGSLDVPRRRDG